MVEIPEAVVHERDLSLLSANQRLPERLEAENAQLRGSVVDLMLQLCFHPLPWPLRAC